MEVFRKFYTTKFVVNQLTMQLIEVHQGEQYLIDPFIRPPICLLLIAVPSLLTILIVKPWSIDLRKSHRMGPAQADDKNFGQMSGQL